MRYRGPIERAAKAAGVDPNRLEALVFLESAGRPGRARAGRDRGRRGADADPGRDRDLAAGHEGRPRAQRAATRAGWTGRCARATCARAAALNRARRRVDDRFDPAKALAGTARYLKLARERFGREDLAFVSYHMGIGNLEGVIERFGGGNRSYAELYFDSTPLRHPKAYARLASFGDDSSNYYWKLGAAIEIMRMARSDPTRLGRLAALQTADDSARQVLLDGAPQGGLRDAAVQPR